MSMYNFEQLLVANELGEVIRLHNQAIERLKAFREQHPHLIAPNLARMAEENLKENVSVLYRELNNLHKPRSEQRRHVCRECHNVFVVPLPGGLCDECRARLTAPAGRYGTRPQMPEAESETLSDVTPLPQKEEPLEQEITESGTAGEVVAGEPVEEEVVAGETGTPDGDSSPEAAEETPGPEEEPEAAHRERA